MRPLRHPLMIAGLLITGLVVVPASPAAAVNGTANIVAVAGGYSVGIALQDSQLLDVRCGNFDGVQKVTVDFLGHDLLLPVPDTGNCTQVVRISMIGRDDRDDLVFSGGNGDVLGQMPNLAEIVADLGDGENGYGGSDTTDRVRGGDGRDTLIGLSGRDDLDGFGGDDHLMGGSEGDLLDGGDGDDDLSGGPGDDNLLAGDGDDEVWGDDGDDLIKNSRGDDTEQGGDGNDTYDNNGATDGDVDTIIDSSGDDVYSNPLPKTSNVDEVDLGTGNDTWSQGLLGWKIWISRSGDLTTARTCLSCGDLAGTVPLQVVRSAERIVVGSNDTSSVVHLPLFAAPPAGDVRVFGRSLLDLSVPAGVTVTSAPTSIPVVGSTKLSAPGYQDVSYGPEVRYGSPPSAPGAPTVTAGAGNTVSLAWTGPTSVGSSAVTGYLVDRYLPGNGASVLSTSVPGTSATSSVPGDRVWRFRVRAVNGSGAGAASGTSAPMIAPFTSIDAFTRRQFLDLAGRSATGPELAAWRTALTAGTELPSARIASLAGAAHFGGAVDPTARLYSAYFGRLPDTGGMGYWVGRRRAGITLSSMSSTFAASSEFRSTYGPLTARQFVELVYENVLGRQGDAGGIAYWTNRLAKGSSTRGQVMVQFSESNEHRTRLAGTVNTVNVFYGLLRRMPTSSEVGLWGPQSSTSTTAVTAGLLISAEYSSRL